MAGVFNGKNAFTQPTKPNDTPTHRESNGFDSPAKDAFDALLAPDFGWTSGLDCEWTYPPFEVSIGHPSLSSGQRIEYRTSVSSSHFLGDRPSTHRDLDEGLSWAGTEFGLPPSVEHMSHDIENLLEEDLAFRLAARTDRQHSSVRRGLETNLAELQVAGDALPTHSTLLLLEEEWSRLSTPALSVTSDLTDETSIPIPSTPPNELSVVPAAVVVARDLIPSPLAEAPTIQEPDPGEESKTFDAQIVSSESQLTSTGGKQKRDAAELDDACGSRAKTPSRPNEKKWFSIEGRSNPRRSSQSKVTVRTEYGESCCSRVGDAGYCQFEWCRNGKTKKCGVELIRDRDIVTSHFALHFEDMGYYSMAENNPEWRPHCPWCHDEPTTFDNFLRHINYSELELNLTRCGCGGSINRGNQVRFRARHEATKMHQEWLAQSGANVVAESEDENGEQQPEFVEASSKGTKRRRLNAKVVQTAGNEDEGREQFNEGGCSGTTRRRSKARRTRACVKEEPDEKEGLFVGDTAASRMRRKAKKMGADANEDSDEEEEFVEGSSNGTKRRRLR